jgi:hypothetical protein
MDDADEKAPLMAADYGSSSVFIGVTLDPRPEMCHIGPTRVVATVLIAISRSDNRIVR